MKLHPIQISRDTFFERLSVEKWKIIFDMAILLLRYARMRFINCFILDKIEVSFCLDRIVCSL